MKNKLYVLKKMIAYCALSTFFGACAQDEQSIGLMVHPHVQTTVVPLTRKECKKTLGKNLLKYGYVPLSIQIYNDSDDVLFFRASTFTVPLEQIDDVLFRVSHDAVLTTYLTVAASAIYFWPAIIPSVGLGAWMTWDNARVARKMREEVIEHDTTFQIFPYEKISKTILISAGSCPGQGMFTLFNLHKKTFVPCTFAI